MFLIWETLLYGAAGREAKKGVKTVPHLQF
jgi:hypothetical protein